MVKKRERGGEGKKVVVKRGAWSAEEDQKLVDYIMVHGDNKWRTLPAKAGLNRCGKSCRLRWLNYLRPGIKRGSMSEDEEDLIIRLHNLLGNRWSLIAGRLPGRTDNEIKNHWNTHLSRLDLTINDLNLKLQGGNVVPPVADRVGDSPPLENADRHANLSSELQSGSEEFDIEQLFDFMSMPGLDPSDAVLSSGNSELRVEDYGITVAQDCSYGFDLFQPYDPLGGTNNQGCSDLQVVFDPSEL